MQRNLTAFTFFSAFVPARGAALQGSGGWTFCRNRHVFSAPRPSVLSGHLGQRIETHCALTDDQKAFIFQRSPFHEYRQRRYTASVSDEGTRKIIQGVENEEELEDGLSQGGGRQVTSRETVSDMTVDGRSKDAGVRLNAESEKPPAELDYEKENGRYEQDSPSEPLSAQEVTRSEDSATVETVKVVERNEVKSGLRYSTHEQLREAFYSITGDPLEKDGGRIVLHRGDVKARLMIIGEAPGEQEDLAGKPFVGKAGQLLDKIFEYGGFDMERQVYVTNIAKRRPANNRTPTLKEVQYYIPYLLEEIRLVDPEIIVLAGSVASQAMLGADVRITKIRGQWFRYGEKGPLMMPVFHPAYLLRKPVAKFDMVKDIEEIRGKYLETVAGSELRPLKKVSNKG